MIIDSGEIKSNLKGHQWKWYKENKQYLSRKLSEKNKRYLWGINIEDGFDLANEEASIEECLVSANVEFSKEEFPEVENIFIGELIQYIPAIDGKKVIEQLLSEVISLDFDGAESWFNNLVPEQISSLEESLNSLLRKWLDNNHLNREFSGVINVKKYGLRNFLVKESAESDVSPADDNNINEGPNLNFYAGKPFEA